MGGRISKAGGPEEKLKLKAKQKVAECFNDANA